MANETSGCPHAAHSLTEGQLHPVWSVVMEEPQKSGDIRDAYEADLEG